MKLYILIILSLLVCKQAFCSDSDVVSKREIFHEIEKRYLKKSSEMLTLICSNEPDKYAKMDYISGEINAYLDVMNLIYKNEMYEISSDPCR